MNQPRGRVSAMQESADHIQRAFHDTGTDETPYEVK